MAFLTKAANRGSIATGYDIDNSLKVEADNSEYAEYRLTSTTDRRNFCFSGWVKRTELVNATDGGQLIFASFTEGNEGVLLRWSRENSNYYDGIQVDIGQGGTNYRSYTSSLYRDTSAWYHIVLAVNTRENTASNRWKLYVNGEQVTSWAQQQFPTADFLTSANLSGSKHTIGAYESGGTVYGKNCGYFADFHFIDADQGNVTFLPTDFGEYDDDSGIWKPKEYTGSYGTNGFYLDFESSGSLGADSSGNGNDFTTNNITAADQATDTPTNNFATLNPLIIHGANDYFVITEGGTNIIQSAQVGWGTMTANIAVNSGKWYAEIKSASSLVMIGNSQVDDPVTYSSTHLGQLANTTSLGMGYYNYSGNIYRNAGDVGYGVAWDSGDIMGIALEFKSDGTANMYVAENNVWINSADPAAGTGGAALNYGGALPTGLHFTFAVSLHNNTGETEVNFGGFTTMSISSAASDANGYGTFEYAPPTGYYALCTKNLAEFG